MITVSNACFDYDAPRGRDFALRGVDLEVEPGRILAVVGTNGSGKSTLARLLCAMDIPSSGRVVVDGHDSSEGELERSRVRRLVGYVQQDPFDQIVSARVEEEVSFGPRNLGLDPDEVSRRVGLALDAVGLKGFEVRDTGSLSGGEQQRLALAGVLAMHPGYIVLDEPTSQLDSIARPAFRRLVGSLARREGIGVVMVTHDPLEVMMADRVVELRDGSIVWSGSAMEGFRRARRDAGIIADSPYTKAVQMALEAGYDFERLLTPDSFAELLLEGPGCPDGHKALLDRVRSELSSTHGALRERVDRAGSRRGLVLQNVSFSYEGACDAMLQQVSLSARPGEVLLVAGPSGSGKSTLACVACGLYEPDGGTATVDGAPAAPYRCGLSFQRPEDQLYQASVYDELAVAPRSLGLDEEAVEARVRAAAGRVGIADSLLDASPFELSGGQARRVGIACILTMGVSACVLDEPTAGLDAPGRRDLHALVRELAEEGVPVVVISHDLDEWIPVVDRVALVSRGRVAWTGPCEGLLEDSAPWDAAEITPPEGIRLLQLIAKGVC